MFVYRPVFNTLELKTDKNTDCYWLEIKKFNWPKIPLRTFTCKNCLFGVTNIAKKSDKAKWVYSCCGIAFDGKGK